jgi:hypothetical protein
VHLREAGSRRLEPDRATLRREACAGGTEAVTDSTDVDGREGAGFRDQVDDPICEDSLRKEVCSAPRDCGDRLEGTGAARDEGFGRGDPRGCDTRKKALERGGKGSDDGSQRESISGVEAVWRLRAGAAKAARIGVRPAGVPQAVREETGPETGE